MPKESVRRLPAVRSLYEIIPKGVEGGKEFGRIVDLLIVQDARRSGRTAFLFDDAAGDFNGLDSFDRGSFRKEGTTGYQYKFFASPLGSNHRSQIEKSLAKAAINQQHLELRKWILVTPQDFLESGQKKGGGDVTWFDSLAKKFERTLDIEHWGHTKLLGMFLESPSLCLFYYPELVESGHLKRKTISEIRNIYDKNLLALYRDINFVGMSVYKQDATRGVPIHEIYIPLKMVPNGVADNDGEFPQQDPLKLLEQGSQHVLLGDPGSGKSTLIRFLALSGLSKQLQERYGAKPDTRLFIVVILRKYAEELKKSPDLGLLDYIVENLQADFSLRSADYQFFEYYLESAQTALFFDGLDELPSSHFKEVVRDRIRSFLLTYPGNTAVVSSRIVGYDEPFRFDEKTFSHFRLSALRLKEIEQFVRDWYQVRIDNKAERDRNVADLTRIVRDDDHAAIRQLAENPLLLTIVTLVHRIDAVLPDERVVLYQKCTETLLNTWHTWKFREAEQRNRGRIERRNRARMEAIAHWMQATSGQNNKSARAVVPYDDLLRFVASHIGQTEPHTASDAEPIDSAMEFIEFVKKRAGLMIEAGDGLYSFVHLTFQEYLSATYLITANEVAGAAGIWSTVEQHCRDPRWHEVIRLLMGGLRAPESQDLLLKHLLNVSGDPHHRIAELLGGFLLDGIEPAEQSVEEIVARILAAAKDVQEIADCQRLTHIVRAWARKDRYDISILRSTARVTIDAVQGESALGPILVAAACGLEESWLIEELGRDTLNDYARYFAGLFFAPNSGRVLTKKVWKGLDRLFNFAARCIVTSPEANLVGARIQSIFWRAEYPVAAEYSLYLCWYRSLGDYQADLFRNSERTFIYLVVGA